ncbi:MAG: hypothetical protein ACRCTR_03405 [Actinomycetota bacterium]
MVASAHYPPTNKTLPVSSSLLHFRQDAAELSVWAYRLRSGATEARLSAEDLVRRSTSTGLVGPVGEGLAQLLARSALVIREAADLCGQLGDQCAAAAVRGDEGQRCAFSG